MAEHDAVAPAFYARRGGGLADWWTLLHPPYTLWHLSYVVLGAAMAPVLDWTALGLAVLAFFLAVGLAAHALDELKGRPLGTLIPDGVLRAVAAVALAGACALGVSGGFFHRDANWALAAASRSGRSCGRLQPGALRRPAAHRRRLRVGLGWVPCGGRVRRAVPGG